MKHTTYTNVETKLYFENLDNDDTLSLKRYTIRNKDVYGEMHETGNQLFIINVANSEYLYARPVATFNGYRVVDTQAEEFPHLANKPVSKACAIMIKECYDHIGDYSTPRPLFTNKFREYI